MLFAKARARKEEVQGFRELCLHWACSRRNTNLPQRNLIGFIIFLVFVDFVVFYCF
jgi:hypothetical protein